MKNIIKTLILGSVIATTNLYAATSSKSADEFCSDRKDKSFMREILSEDESRMAFQNQGGLVNGGVCWWHSRFQRNATYLTIFRPELKRPSASEAKKIIKAIKKGKSIVQIPGYSNFNDFSYDHRDEIQNTLEAWQKVDGILLQQWVVGLAGSNEVSAEDMESKMHELYKEVSTGDIVYQKLQIKGITAHAWLVIDMEKTKNGYELMVIDSNMPSRTDRYVYEYGDTSFYHYYYGNFVPYTGKDAELERLKKTVSKYCN